MIRFDHIALAADTLEAGADLVRARLGVKIGPGGAHPLMGTHNLLGATGPDSFLEVIAADPGAPPARPRWFGLDRPETLTHGPRPFLVAATDDLDAALAAAARAGFDLGRPEALRRGELHWRFAVTANGAPAEDGAAPLLIEWPAGPHPAGRMADAGLRCAGVTLRTPRPERLRALMAALGAANLFAIAEGAAGVVATFTGPGGAGGTLEPMMEALP
ncbi:VOC family protein [Rubrimonas cliftonensis]|uniref:Glyoxalase-like domain-containing protein n=1 Tax=Rubrimonas cliftonensis TaxID=89524 RepID=A0A1H4EC85_9RHOB|nr:VOC family protein [Rubrimonas cliftonensis]SEA82664.1 Glyoxalase-like domain-containing protein [Rubrimonas cliftonensis]